MLRFDVPPVWSNVIRVEAFITTAVCALALALNMPLLMLLLVVQGFVRGVLGHYKCPSHVLWGKLLQRLQRAGKQENAGAKMFANKLLLVASTVAVVLALSGLEQWRIPAVALIVFSILEWAFAFCAACWAYTAWYRLTQR
ncbi:MAG: DUF4395 family protein [Burkholderiaceae bacterium]